jgi:nucleoside phosphorylase/tetratricopeptide (TPR) repeat protein
MRGVTHVIDCPNRADVALLTIVPETYEAVRGVFELNSFTVRAGVEWAYGIVQAQGRNVVVVSGLALDRENVAAAIFTDLMLEAWHPEHLIMVDIAGAVKGRDDIDLGDVVTHTHLHYYDFQKETGAGVEEPRYLPHAAPSARLRELSRRPKLRGDHSWKDRISKRRPRKGTPKVLEGEMLVGGTLFANSPRLHRLLDKHTKVLAVEMEGAGAARSVLDWSLRGRPPEFLIVRGMSDFCNVPPEENQRTRDKWKPYAAWAAAAHVRALVGEFDPDPETQGPPRFSALNREIDNLWQAPFATLTGRDDVLTRLSELFSAPETEPRSGCRHAICGEPGVGKSALARTVAARVANKYQIRWWIDASDELKIRAGLRDLAAELSIPSASLNSASSEEEGSAHPYLSDLHSYLSSGLLSKRALVLLDNIDDPALKHNIDSTALRYLPREVCDVLLTSQSQRWRPIASSTRLGGLTTMDGAKLIALEADYSANDPALRKLSAIFGGRPLLLKQIAVLISDGDEPSQLSARFEQAPEETLEALPELEGFDALWRTTYGLALERAEAAREGTRLVMEALSCWSAEPIPFDLLAAIESGSTSVASREARLNTLADRCLIERQGTGEKRSCLVHRVVAAAVRALAHERRHLARAIEVAVQATVRSLPQRGSLGGSEGQQVMARVGPHAAALIQLVLKHFEDLSGGTRSSAAECASVLGLYRRMLSEWGAAEESCRAAIRLSDPNTEMGAYALRKVRLANILRQRGQFDAAETILDEALPALAAAGDPRDHAWAMTVKARILRHRPRSSPQEALTLLEEAREILGSTSTKDDAGLSRQTSELHGYLSVVHRQLSELDAAEFESEEGIRLASGGPGSAEILERSEIPLDRLVAVHLRALGGVWRLRGEFARAQRAHARALSIFEGLYGAEHIDVLRGLDSLGRVQREWGDFEGAVETFWRAKRLSEAQFNRDHAHVATAGVNLAITHLEMFDPASAFREADMALETYRKAYNEPVAFSDFQNEATIWALFVRADALAALGRVEEAIADHGVIRGWRSSRLPPLHAHHASSLFALADALLLQSPTENLEVALQYHRTALQIREHVFGTEPNFWLAQSQARLGELTRDQLLLESALAFYARQLRDGHWRTRAVEAALGLPQPV